MTTVFVTSSGTEIGKTFVTAQLVTELAAAGYRVRALKPVASGFDIANAAESDSARLLAAQRLTVTPANLDAISPWRFAAPLSPDLAAAREGRSIPFAELVDFCRSASSADVTLIEGIGGVMVPLDAEHTVLDWIDALGAPVLLVVGSYLGTLSHTLTAELALRTRGSRVAAIIVSESAEQPLPAADTAATLRRFLPSIPVRVLARGAATETQALLPLVAPLLV